MQLQKIILGLTLSITLMHTWADDQSINPSDNSQSTETTVKPAVTLPHDNDDIDAAPDDNEFDSSEHSK